MFGIHGPRHVCAELITEYKNEKIITFSYHKVIQIQKKMHLYLDGKFVFLAAYHTIYRGGVCDDVNIIHPVSKSESVFDPVSQQGAEDRGSVSLGSTYHILENKYINSTQCK